MAWGCCGCCGCQAESPHVLRDLDSGGQLQSSALPPAPPPTPPWRTMADTPKPSSSTAVLQVSMLTLSSCCTNGACGKVGQLSRKKPTRDGQVLMATQGSPIIGPDTLPLHTPRLTPGFTKRPWEESPSAQGNPQTCTDAHSNPEEGRGEVMATEPHRNVKAARHGAVLLLLVVGCCLLAVGCWLLVAGCCVRGVGSVRAPRCCGCGSWQGCSEGRLVREKVRKECSCVVSRSARCRTWRDEHEVF